MCCGAKADCISLCACSGGFCEVVAPSFTAAMNDLTVSGACASQSQLNGVYVYQGLTLDGKAYYKNGGGYYIYYDQDCDGADGSLGAPEWIIDNDRPSTTASVDLDGGGGTCRQYAYIDSASNTIPYGDNVWTMNCNSIWTDVDVNIGPIEGNLTAEIQADAGFYGCVAPTTTTTTATATSTTTTCGKRSAL